MPRLTGAWPAREGARWRLTLMGEPVGWCVRSEHVLREVLAERGFVYSPDESRFDLRARYLLSAALANLGPCTLPELMAVAERG